MQTKKISNSLDYVANQIADKMANEDINCVKLSKLSGVSIPTISELISKRSYPSLMTVLKLVDALGMNLIIK